MNDTPTAAADVDCHCERNNWEHRPGDGGTLIVCADCGYIAAITGEGAEYSPGVSLHQVTLTLCSLCLLGEGGECHTPGCSLWMHAAPDIPLTLDAAAVTLAAIRATVPAAAAGPGTDRVTVGDLVTPLVEADDHRQPPPDRPSSVKGGRLAGPGTDGGDQA